MIKCFLGLGITIGLALVSGCATASFERDWEHALKTHRPSNTLAGPWEGTWRSTKNDHNGTLRAVARPSGDPGVFDTRFMSTWGMNYTPTFSFPARTDLRLEGTEFSGQQDLGWLYGGTYDYNGSIADGTFRATYACERDEGVFEMSRPGRAE